jgi:hypothetical protein
MPERTPTLPNPRLFCVTFSPTVCVLEYLAVEGCTVSHEGCACTEGFRGTARSLDSCFLVLMAALRALQAVLGAVKAVLEALQAVRRVLKALPEAMQALLRAKSPERQECQQNHKCG